MVRLLFDRGDANYVETAGLRKCFLTGGNSTLRQHCRRHYQLYKEKCKEAGIPVNHHAIPPKLAQAQAEEKKEMLQTKLDNTFLVHPEVFTREAVLHAVAQFVACDDQVSTMSNISGPGQYLPVHSPASCPWLQAFAVANNKLFRNCLVSMRPKTKSSDIPSSHDVGVYIHNECVKWLKQLREEITVSMRACIIAKDSEY
jgi:hypothetical protein